METVTLQGSIVLLPTSEYEAIMNRLQSLEQAVSTLAQLLEDSEDIKMMRETEVGYRTGDVVDFSDLLAEVQAKKE